MAIQDILDRLQDVRSNGDSYRAQCPCGHNSSGQLSLKELYDGRILMHGHCGHSAGEILEAIDMKLSDLYEEPLDKHIRPLYMAREDTGRARAKLDRINHCTLRLDLAEDMRKTGRTLTEADLRVERECYFELKELKGEEV